MLKLAYSNLEFQNFPGEDPEPPSSRGVEGRGRKGRRGKERGRGRIGKGRGQGGKEGGEEWGRGGGARHGLRPPPQRQALDPPLTKRQTFIKYPNHKYNYKYKYKYK